VHDFAAFGQPTQGKSSAGARGIEGSETARGLVTVRELFDADWQLDGSWFIFDVVGNAFLRGMVRSLVGTLLQVGAGSWPIERVAEVLQSQNRALAAPPVPACGLCLMRVEY
jgi:tRNA pseudouridine38-40 synthase